MTNKSDCVHKNNWISLLTLSLSLTSAYFGINTASQNKSNDWVAWVACHHKLHYDFKGLTSVLPQTVFVCLPTVK